MLRCLVSGNTISPNFSWRMFSTYLHFKHPIRFADKPSKGLGKTTLGVSTVISGSFGMLFEGRSWVTDSRPAGLFTKSHCREDSASKVSMRKEKNS